jgi:hypothetical protein
MEDEIMSIPQRVLKVMELAGKSGDRPLDRLEQGKPIVQGREAVARLSEKDIPGIKMPQALLFLQGALYLYFDCIEKAHQIAQDHEGTIGNWLHALLHRREPDAGNSKYWYARVKIPSKVGQGIAEEALKRLGGDVPPELKDLHRKMLKSGDWEPAAFVDLCDKLREKDPRSRAYQGLARLQEIEWRALLDFILGP